MKRIAVRTLKGTLALALAFVLFALFVQTPPGKALLASSVSRLLSRSANVEVRIGEVKGWVPGGMYIDELEIGDGNGIWLSVYNLHARWTMRELLVGRIKLKQLSADKVEIARLPQTGGKAPDLSKGRWLENMAFELTGLQIGQLAIDRAVAGAALEYTVSSGGIALKSGDLSGTLSISGDAVGSVEFDASLRTSNVPVLHLQADLERLNHPRFGMDRISGRGDATINPAGIEARIDIDIEENGQAGKLTARLVHDQPRLTLKEFHFTSPQANVNGNLDLVFGRQAVDVSFDASLVDAATNRYAAHGAAAVATSNKTWSVAVRSMELTALDVVSLNLAGTVDAKQVDLAGELDGFDVGELPFRGFSNFTGRAEGEFAIHGSTRMPNVSAGIGLSGFRNAAEALDELPALDLHIAAGITNQTLFASTSLTNFSAGHLVAEATVPCDFSLAPVKLALHRTRANGALEAVLDLDVLNRLALLGSQHVSGVLSASVSVDNSEPSGYVLMEQGAYEHYDLGIHFRDFKAELAVTPDGVLINKARATDGQDGRLRLTGGIYGGMLDLVLNLTAAKVVQRAEANATISGELKLSGLLGHPSIRGILVVDQAEILPDNMMPPTLEPLTGFNAVRPVEDIVEPKSEAPWPYDLDLRVDMPGQVHVNASLIDSIWGGRLWIEDSPAGIRVEGRIEPRHGFVDFIGKKFRFEQGAIAFDGSTPPVPVFDNLTTVYTRGAITARLILNGKLNNPQYQLESTPSLPEDEILSQVLFNRDTSSISAYQAFQIASAAQQLSGGLSGPGFMYQFRRTVGIDTFEVREPEEEGGDTSVAAGKYIASSLYFEVSSTFGEESRTDVSAEYEINRHFSVETSAGPSLRPGIGLNWKNDY